MSIPEKVNKSKVIRERLAAGDKQADIARELGVSTGYVSSVRARKKAKDTRSKNVSKIGRGLLEIDWDLVDASLALNTQNMEEVASLVGVSYDTLKRATLRVKGVILAEYAASKRASGFHELRLSQFETATGNNLIDVMTRDGVVKMRSQPNPAMQQWLGRNWLGQKETVDVESDTGGVKTIGITGLDV